MVTLHFYVAARDSNADWVLADVCGLSQSLQRNALTLF
jgi:hypothetical protein